MLDNNFGHQRRHRAAVKRSKILRYLSASNNAGSFAFTAIRLRLIHCQHLGYVSIGFCLSAIDVGE